jgi:hypothetical protein
MTEKTQKPAGVARPALQLKSQKFRESRQAD